MFTWVEINLGYLKSNLKTIRSMLRDRKVGILAVVKADAYGHGMKQVAGVLAKNGVRFFGVANLEEALELRRGLKNCRILVLGSFHSDDARAYIRARITPTISSLEDADAFERALHGGKTKFPVHVKIDTGMGRLGVWHEEAGPFFKRLSERGHLAIEGVYTHFSRADHAEKRFTRRQLFFFEKAAAKIKKLGIRPLYFHAANSMGVLRFKRAHLNLVRPGLILYGISPSKHSPLPAALKPVLSLKTKISFLKNVGQGRTLSYGATYRSSRPTRIATLPIGYSHGYRLAFSNKAFVLVQGRRCPVVGRVTMDQTLVDVGEVPSVKRWNKVTLIGGSGKAAVLAEELAQASDSIPYEVLCSINSRIPRIYKGIH